VLVVAAGAVTLFSRDGTNITATYPELVTALGALLDGASATLDGEVVALNAAGRPDIGLLQQRMHVGRPSAALVGRVPVAYYVFDLLGTDGASVTAAPYRQRREVLDGLSLEGGSSRTPLVRVPPYYTGIDGAELLEVAGEHRLKGVVSKLLDSPYRPGQAQPGLDQGRAADHPGGGDRWLADRQGPRAGCADHGGLRHAGPTTLCG
jgi:bifunctional non-homologous end joining protein LigD